MPVDISMTTSDTAVTEANLSNVSLHQFQVVQLATLAGQLGSTMWAAPSQEVAADRRASVGTIRQRLLVSVHDDPRSSEAIKRVRDALGLSVLPMQFR